jgi:Zn-dependent peptidase ImmA (M78 family)
MRLRCTLAHELGHAVTGCGAEPIGGDQRDEARAMRWARRLLMPGEWMLERVGRTAWEICEDAGVYQRWAEARIEEMERALLYV